MSAIIAIYNLDKSPIDTSSAEMMLNTMRHRGSDGLGVFSDNNVALGHRMLWTTEESLLEKLPLKNLASNCVITADARIDNRKELIDQLSFNGKKPNEITDSEIILTAYEHWGEECLDKLIGDFVFAIWNPKTKKLFCGRDSMGIKHFYYYYNPGKVFILASEIKALFALEYIKKEIDEVKIGDYLVLNFEDKENTFFKNIKRLPGNHGLSITENDFKKWSYWHPDPHKEIKLKNHHEYHEAFREKFTESVDCRLRSAYPIGSALSGGLDSSAIVCVASEKLASVSKPPLNTFSAIFPTVSKVDLRIDEINYINSVIEKTGCKAHFIDCDNDNPLKDQKKLMWYADSPIGVPNIYIHWNIFKQVKNVGVRTFLDGFDGDSVVSHGYEEFELFAKKGWWFRLFKESLLLNKNMPSPFHKFSNLAVKNGLRKIIPLDVINPLHHLKFKNKDHEKTPDFNELHWKVTKTDFKKRYKLEERFRHFSRLLPKNSTNIESRWHGLTSGLYSYQLELSELLSQAFSIEIRYPFFDRRLVEFCNSLPIGERLYNGWTRAIFRHSMTGILPNDVQWRASKSNLSAGISLNMHRYSSIELESLFNSKNDLLENYIDLNKLKSVYKRFMMYPQNRFNDCFMLAMITKLSIWLKSMNY